MVLFSCIRREQVNNGNLLSIDGIGDGNNITLSLEPPADPEYNDLWIDAENYYMYIYTPTRSGNWGSWVAVTGPGGVDGGSDIVNNSTVTLLPNRGINVASGGSFKLNQPKNHIIEFSPSNIVILDDNPPTADERLKSDIWIDTKDYKMYVWNEYEWVGLSSGDSDQTGQGFNYIPCEVDGGFSTEEHCKDCNVGMDGGFAITEHCDFDDIFAHKRPGVIIGSEPPKAPILGEMWFDTSRLETRIWYGTENSTPRWVSALNPGASPILPPDPDPEPVRVSGPNSAIAGIASNNFSCAIGENLPLPSFAWSTTDERAYIQPVGTREVVQIVFDKPGTHKVAVSVSDRTLDDIYTDFVKVVVTEAPQNITSTYEVQMKYIPESGSEKYVINNQESPYLTFVRGRKYLFVTDHYSVITYPLRLFSGTDTGQTDEKGNTIYEWELFEDGVIYGDNNTNLEVQIASDAPAVLKYDWLDRNPSLPEFGNLIYVVGDYVSDLGALSIGQRPIPSPNKLTANLQLTVQEVDLFDEDGNPVLDDGGNQVKVNRQFIPLPPDLTTTDPDEYTLQQQPDLWMFARNTIPGESREEFYTYRFTNEYPQNNDHPFGLFLDADNTVPFLEGLTYSDSNTVIDFIPTAEMPAILYYGCTTHPGMGGKINILRSAT